MFSNCCLSHLYKFYLNTKKIINVYKMFYQCYSVDTLDVSHFNTESLTTMGYMFNGCAGLTSLDLSSFNTEKVTNMENLFQFCGSLTSLDLSSFNTEKVTNMHEMFANNYHLATIYVGDGWSTQAVTNSNSMFYYCQDLVGGRGTAYDENHQDAEYAHIDGGSTNPGYFTRIKNYIDGDVNKDGKVSIADVTALINYLLSGDDSNINLQAADSNENGEVRISDVTTLINYLLSGTW